MSNTIVVGIQSGDEGKGKISDYLMDRHDICVRYSGGGNTGATVIVEGKKYKFHHIPVGIIRNKPCFIASSVYIEPNKLKEEIQTYKDLGIDVDKLLKISPDCHLVTQDHINRDCTNEATSAAVGSTKRGISPCASDKFGRKGIKIETLDEFEKYFADVPLELNEAIKNKQSILFEGSQGTLLDIDHGTIYPHISTTSNVAGAACASCGVGPTKIDYVFGVFKAYMTKVGTGPFPTEIEKGKINDIIVNEGNEFGTTTGRRRKVGWIDLPALRYAIRINGCNRLSLMKFDVLENLKRIKVCNSYKLNGKEIFEIPVKKLEYCKCVPNYQSFSDLTIEKFCDIIESKVGCSISIVSYGPDRINTKELM